MSDVSTPTDLLRSRTAPHWADRACADLPAVLTDHAHCEKKAAASAMSLIAAFPEKIRLVRAMARLAQEELAHFRQVYDRLQDRGITLTRDQGDPYARALRKLVRPQPDADRLTDLLLISALIEARSHERLALLADALSDPDLRRFYATLAVAEAGHARLFVDLARTYANPDAVDARLDTLALAEAEIVAKLPVEPRIH